MITYIYADALSGLPALRDSMFRDRAHQFKTRLKWDVSVDENGWERDQYDTLNPLYVIARLPDGRHGGSMRILPTTAEVMVNDFFGHLTGGVRISSPLIWECTRFCISPEAGEHAGRIAGALMLSGVELGLRVGLTHSVGVFDARMVRIYRRIGWEPEILGTEGGGANAVSVGLWAMSQAARDAICARTGFTPRDARDWFDGSFPEQMAQTLQVA